MAVFTLSVVDQVFDKKSAEANYLCKLLQLAAASIQNSQGTQTSGSLVMTVPSGTGSGVVGTWQYNSSASRP
jgi:hypothetical protein